MIVSTTAIIILFLCPGLIFRYILFQGTSRKIRISNLNHVYWAIVKAVIFHIVFLTVIYISDTLPNIDFIVWKGIINNELNLYENEIIYSFRYVILYSISIVAVAWLFALLFRFIIIKFRWYELHTAFVIDNYWEMVINPVYVKSKLDVDKDSKLFVMADVLMNAEGGNSYLYSGIIEDYDVDDKENLNTIFLVDVFRRNLIDDNTNEHNSVNIEANRDGDLRYYRVKGDLFAARAENIKNVNISYYTIKKENED